MTLAIGHVERGRIVIDAQRESRAHSRLTTARPVTRWPSGRAR
jgi:hypothetical protein